MLPQAVFQACASQILRSELQSETGPSLPGSATRCRGRKILVVEDDEVSQDFMVELLRQAGAQVAVANTGLAVLDILRREPVDMILMDCQLPLMDGYEVTRCIRENARWQGLPIIALTANVMNSDRNRALASGMNEHVGKPLRVDTLFETIARCFEPTAGKRAGSPKR